MQELLASMADVYELHKISVLPQLVGDLLPRGNPSDAILKYEEMRKGEGG